jgi:hypothetical protein
MDVPVTTVEWVGDMCAPSLLPNRTPSLSPEPRPVIDTPMEDAPDTSDKDTVKKTVSPHKRTVVPKVVPVGRTRDLFSDYPQRHITQVPSQRMSNLLNGSPLRVERTRERPRRRLLVRPRLSTETFQSPSGPPSKPHGPATVTTGSYLPIQETRRWPQVHQAPKVPPASRTRHFSTQHTSLDSSEDSEFSDPEWFTPPSTRRDKRKAPQRNINLEKPPTISGSPILPFSPMSPTAHGTHNNLSPRLTTRTMEDVPARKRGTATKASGNRMKVQKTPSRRVTIDAPDSSPTTDNLYARPNRQVSHRNTARNDKNRSMGRSSPTIKPESPKHQMVQVAPNSHADSPSSVYSRSISGEPKKNPRSEQDSPSSSPPTPPQHRVSIHAIDTPLSATSPGTFHYSRFASKNFRSPHPSPPQYLDGAPPASREPLDICAQMASASVRKPQAGRPRNDCSFDAGVYLVKKKSDEKFEVTAITKKITGTAIAADMAELKDEQKALGKEVAALREEFRAFKTALLLDTSGV